jgi:hypothetical protein
LSSGRIFPAWEEVYGVEAFLLTDAYRSSFVNESALSALICGEEVLFSFGSERIFPAWEEVHGFEAFFSADVYRSSFVNESALSALICGEEVLKCQNQSN